MSPALSEMIRNISSLSLSLRSVFMRAVISAIITTILRQPPTGKPETVTPMARAPEPMPDWKSWTNRSWAPDSTGRTPRGEPGRFPRLPLQERLAEGPVIPAPRRRVRNEGVLRGFLEPPGEVPGQEQALLVGEGHRGVQGVQGARQQIEGRLGAGGSLRLCGGHPGSTSLAVSSFSSKE